MKQINNQLSKKEYDNLQTDKYLQENNKRAYELLMRIQSQIAASTVIATATKRDTVYE